MLRHRTVAAAPARSTSETWCAITDLIVDTLDRSAGLDRTSILASLAAGRAAGMMLIAGGHLEQHPLTLIADPVHLQITTVSGADALTLEENLGPVPGGVGADGWTLHLPTPDPVGSAITESVRGQAHLSATDPFSPVQQASGTRTLINAAALAARAEAERR